MEKQQIQQLAKDIVDNKVFISNYVVYKPIDLPISVDSKIKFSIDRYVKLENDNIAHLFYAYYDEENIERYVFPVFEFVNYISVEDYNKMVPKIRGFYKKYLLTQKLFKLKEKLVEIFLKYRLYCAITVCDEKIFGFIVSNIFLGVNHPDRQSYIFNILKKRLKQRHISNIAYLVILTHDEYIKCKSATTLKLHG